MVIVHHIICFGGKITMNLFSCSRVPAGVQLISGPVLDTRSKRWNLEVPRTCTYQRQPLSHYTLVYPILSFSVRLPVLPCGVRDEFRSGKYCNREIFFSRIHCQHSWRFENTTHPVVEHKTSERQSSTKTHR